MSKNDDIINGGKAAARAEEQALANKAYPDPLPSDVYGFIDEEAREQCLSDLRSLAGSQRDAFINGLRAGSEYRGPLKALFNDQP